jgi:hypothetical protein
MRGRRTPGWVRSALLGIVALFILVACQPTLQRATGIVLNVDSPVLGQVDSFELLTPNGERIVFDASEMEFRSEFPAPHLAEHQILGDRIVVTYKRDADRLVVTQLDDAE